jgi:histidine phosphotransferase ChpT
MTVSMSSDIDTRLVELLCSRLLHDLISPLSAISNGVELMREGGLEDEALDLVEDAVRQATRRVQALRLAWGAAGAESGVAPVRAAALAWFEGSRIGVTWPETVTAPLVERRGGAKLLLNAVLLAGEALPGQGTVHVAEDGSSIAVTASGRAPSLKGAGEAWLGTAPPVAEQAEANDVNAAYTAALARSYGLRLELARTPDTLTLRLSEAG